MLERTRAEYDRFLDRLEELQAQRVKVDVALQLVCDQLPDEEVELIARMRMMCGQEAKDVEETEEVVEGASS